MDTNIQELLDRLESDIAVHEMTGNGQMKRVQNIRDAVKVIKELMSKLGTPNPDT
jgi:hypothetical protein